MTRAAPSLLLALLALFAIAGAPAAQDVLRRDGEPEVHLVEESDPEMNAAIEEARRSVGRLVERWSELQAEGVYASIKVPVAEAGEVEHIWLSDVSFDEGRVHGNLGNAPFSLPSWSLGDPISVPLDRISDWMVVRNGQLIGGYSLFVIRGRLTGDDLESFDRQVGLAFPDRPRELE